MDKLILVITGPEHNGTTYVEKLIYSHPDIFCGIECGMLSDNAFFKNDEPFKEWIYLPEYNWGLSKEIKLNINIPIEKRFELLYNNKGSGSDIIQKLIKESKYLVDKTPYYFRDFETVYNNVNKYNIPIIISIKSLKENYFSYVIKRKVPEEIFIDRIKLYLHTLRWLNINKDKLKNVYLFSYNDIIQYNSAFIKKLKDILKFKINVNCELSLEIYNNKIKDFNNKPWYHNWKNEYNENITISNNVLQYEKEFNELIDTLKINLSAI